MFVSLYSLLAENLNRKSFALLRALPGDLESSTPNEEWQKKLHPPAKVLATTVKMIMRFYIFHVYNNKTFQD